MCHIVYSYYIIYVLAPVKKKAENGGGKRGKIRFKTKPFSSDSDSEEQIFSSKEAPVSNNTFHKL